MKLSSVLLTFFFSLQLFGLEKAGVSYPDKLSFKEKTLILNGVGVREATIFNVDVYVAALYLVKKEKEANNILKTESDKVLKMTFVRDVDSEKMDKAWKDSLSEVEYKKSLKQLLAVSRDLKKGDTITLEFSQGQVAYLFNKKRLLDIKDKKFSQKLLSVWLGPKPPNKGLKTGLLGQ